MSADDRKGTELTSRIEVENLVINPRQRRELSVGDTDSFSRIATDTKGIQAVIWNEGYLALITRDPSTVITFRPELNPSVAMFFQRETKRDSSSMYGKNDIGNRVWEGDFEPVSFTKANLVRFLKEYSSKENTELLESIQEMKITESKSRTEKMISLDDENFTATEEQTLRTNIPTAFSLEMSLVESGHEKVLVTMNFQAAVVKAEERYGEEKGKKHIQLRCTNSRKIMHDLMKGYADMLPVGLPKYYGRLTFEGQP